jgi:hypothetical protein
LIDLRIYVINDSQFEVIWIIEPASRREPYPLRYDDRLEVIVEGPVLVQHHHPGHRFMRFEKRYMVAIEESEFMKWPPRIT